MKEAIETKLNQIAQCIYEGINNNSISNMIGVYNGNFGILLFLYYYSAYSKNQKYIELTDMFADRLLDRLGKSSDTHTFCSGLSGVLYLFNFLRKSEFVDIEIEEIEDVFHNYIIRSTDLDIQRHYYDFMHGALGSGLYFLEKGNRPKEIYKLIDFLYETAEKNEDEKIFCWKSSIGLSGEIGYNIALSHGISSIVLFLSRVSLKGFSHPHLSELLTGSVNYLLSQEIDPAIYGSYFPSQSKEKILKGRLGWCYGDLGVAYALWFAGKASGIKQWQEKALKAFNFSTTRKSIQESMVADAGICHGSSGIAMFFNRMYLETKDEIYKAAYHFWIGETLNQARFEDGLAGYRTYGKDEHDLNPDYSLLTGIAGIGMVLMSYLMEDNQAWDELFLLSY